MRAWQCFRLLVVFVILWIVYLWNSEKMDNTEQKENKKKTDTAVYNDMKYRIVGKECSSANPSHCYTITDAFYIDGSGRSVGLRMLLLDKLSKYAFTMVRLQVPQTMNTTELLYGNWSVDKSVVNAPILQAQIALGFVTEALSYNSREKQQILMLGLGGGDASNFLSLLPTKGIQIETTVVELDPFMVGIAARYFEHREVPGLTNIVVDNGIRFLEQAVKNGTKYRSILLDACYDADETRTGLLCPVKEFYQSQTVKNIFDSLEDGGIFTANTISDANAADHEQRALREYRKVFPSCYLAPYNPDRNMLVCSKRRNWNWKEQSAKFQNNLEVAIGLFNFETLPRLRDFYGAGSPSSSSSTVSPSLYLIFAFFFTH